MPEFALPIEASDLEEYDWDGIHAQILAYARTRLGSTELAEDVAQEALAKLIAWCRSHEVATVYGLAFQITKNLIVDHHRSNRYVYLEVPDQLVCEQPLPDRIVLGKQELSCINSVLANMPKLRREVLMRRRLEGQACSTIARELNLSLAAVEKHITRGLADLDVALRRLDD